MTECVGVLGGYGNHPSIAYAVNGHVRMGTKFFNYTTGESKDNVVIKKYKEQEIVAEVVNNEVKYKLRKIVFSDTECAVCFYELKSRYAVIPCGHINTCGECLKTVKNCPSCRNPITTSVKLFI